MPVQAGLVYGVSIGDPNKSLGVFLPGQHVSDSEAFGWELILTFVLVRLPTPWQLTVNCCSRLTSLSLFYTQ